MRAVLRASALVLGVLLIAGAFLTAYWITPTYVARLPDDVNAERTYTGTFATLLDTQAAISGNFAAAVKQNVPLSIDRRVKVQQTTDGTALVNDTRTTSAGATPVERTSWNYALDRYSLEPVTNHPSSWSVVAAKGLTVSFPIGAQKKTYTGWVPETATTIPVSYLRSEQRSGLTTYVYQDTIPATTITDGQVLAGLPKAVPQSLLRLLVQSGPLPASARAQLLALLPTLPDPVPLSYTLQESDTYWVEPETGEVIDVNRSQQRRAGLSTSTGFVELLPISDASYRQSPQSVTAATNDADNAKNAILWIGTIAPIIAGVLGALLILVALLTRRRRPRGPERP